MYHGFVCVLLELDQADSGDVLQVHVSVRTLRGVSVQVGRGGRWGDPQSLVTVNLVGDHVVGLQQRLLVTQSTKRGKLETRLHTRKPLGVSEKDLAETE